MMYTCLFSSKGAALKPLLTEPYDPQALEQFIRRTWAGRDDRYSETRDLQSPSGKGPEMYRMGG